MGKLAQQIEEHRRALNSDPQRVAQRKREEEQRARDKARHEEFGRQQAEQEKLRSLLRNHSDAYHRLVVDLSNEGAFVGMRLLVQQHLTPMYHLPSDRRCLRIRVAHQYPSRPFLCVDDGFKGLVAFYQEDAYPGDILAVDWVGKNACSLVRVNETKEEAEAACSAAYAAFCETRGISIQDSAQWAVRNWKSDPLQWALVESLKIPVL